MTVAPVGYTGPWDPPIVQEGTTEASEGPWIQAGAGYRYLTTDLLTGALRGDWLPIEGQSFTRAVSASGDGTAALYLIDGGTLDTYATPEAAANRANLAAVTPAKSVLWVLYNGAVIWNGIIWDWDHQSITDGTLPLGLSTVDSILARRVINTTLEISGDIFDIARALVGYALGKTPNGGIAGLTFMAGECGISDSLTFDQSQRQTVMDALNTLVSVYEIEWAFRPYQDAAGNFLTSFDLGYPALGQPFPASGLDYQFPGNVNDYGFAASASSGASRILATAQASGNTGDTLVGRATDETLAGQGYPLTETAVSASAVDWITNTPVKAFATGQLLQADGTMLTPLLTLPGGAYPTVADTVLGSYAQVNLTSPLHPCGPAGQPGFQGTGRVVSWTLFPPQAQQAETLQVQMGEMDMDGAAAHVID